MDPFSIPYLREILTSYNPSQLDEEKKQKNSLANVLLQSSSDSNLSSKSLKERVETHKDAIPLELLPWVEDEKEEEIDADQKEKISAMFDQYFVELPPDHPFTKTDLVIFKDDYPGALPINGIKESDFESLQKLYNMIDNKDPAAVIQIKGNDKFHQWFMEQILLLSTRPSGREILRKIQEKTVYQSIEVYDGSAESKGSEVEKPKDEKMVKVYLDMLSNLDVLQHEPTGKLGARPEPAHIIVGHELIHCLHILHGENSDANITKPIIYPDYHKLEEQKTITGYKSPLVLPDRSTLDEALKNLPEESNEYKEVLEKYKQDVAKAWESYDHLNEWTLTTEFADSKHVMYPRFSHVGVRKFPEGVTLDSKEMIAFAKEMLSAHVNSGIDKLQEIGFDWKLLASSGFDIASGAISKSNLSTLILLNKLIGFSIFSDKEIGKLLEKASKSSQEVFDYIASHASNGVSSYLLKSCQKAASIGKKYKIEQIAEDFIEYVRQEKGMMELLKSMGYESIKAFLSAPIFLSFSRLKIGGKELFIQFLMNREGPLPPEFNKKAFCREILRNTRYQSIQNFFEIASVSQLISLKKLWELSFFSDDEMGDVLLGVASKNSEEAFDYLITNLPNSLSSYFIKSCQEQASFANEYGLKNMAETFMNCIRTESGLMELIGSMNCNSLRDFLQDSYWKRIGKELFIQFLMNHQSDLSEIVKTKDFDIYKFISALAAIAKDTRFLTPTSRAAFEKFVSGL